jgi:hypothetical protein
MLPVMTLVWDSFHQKPHQHALCAHRACGKEAGDDAMPIGRASDARAGQKDGDEACEQNGFERQHPGHWRATPVAGERDQGCGDGGRRNECNDRKELAGNARVVAHQLRAGDHEAASNLRGEQPEQRQIRVAVDVAGDEAEQQRHRLFQRLMPVRRGVGHGGSPVIPGPSEARSPESIAPALGLWIPDSPLPRRSGMTVKINPAARP